MIIHQNTSSCSKVQLTKALYWPPFYQIKSNCNRFLKYCLTLRKLSTATVGVRCNVWMGRSLVTLLKIKQSHQKSICLPTATACPVWTFLHNRQPRTSLRASEFKSKILRHDNYLEHAARNISQLAKLTGNPVIVAAYVCTDKRCTLWRWRRCGIEGLPLAPLLLIPSISHEGYRTIPTERISYATTNLYPYTDTAIPPLLS